MNDCCTSQDNKKMKRSLEEEQRARKDLEKVVRRVLKSMNDPTWDETNLWGPCAPSPSEALKRERKSICVGLLALCVNTHNHTHNLRLVVWVRACLRRMCVFALRGASLLLLWWKDRNHCGVMLNKLDHLFHDNIPWAPSEMVRRSHTWPSVCPSSVSSAVLSVAGRQVERNPLPLFTII